MFLNERRLDLDIVTCVGEDEEGYSVFHGLMARQCLLFCCDVSPLGHLLPKEARIVAVKHLLRQISPRVDEALKPRP